MSCSLRIKENLQQLLMFVRQTFPVGDLRKVGGFLRVLLISPINKTDRHNIAEILLKVALNTITLNSLPKLFPPICKHRKYLFCQ